MENSMNSSFEIEGQALSDLIETPKGDKNKKIEKIPSFADEKD